MHIPITRRQAPRRLDHASARIFLKGLTDDPMHNDASISSLFASFGLQVESVDRFGPYKERVFYRGSGKRVRVRYGRRFAFLNVSAAAGRTTTEGDGEGDGEGDEHRATAFRNLIHKAVRSLDGTTWKGTTLVCQVAKTRGDELVRQEIAEEERLLAEARAEGAGEEQIVFTHEKEQVSGENKLRWDDDDGEEDCGVRQDIDLWGDIETPRQWVYNYERHLRKVAAARGEGPGFSGQAGEIHGQAGNGTPEGQNKKSLVERFLEQQDIERANRREEREKKEKESFGAVYADGQRSDGKNGSKKRRCGDLEEEEDRVAVVEFWSDGEHEEDNDAASRVALQNKVVGVDLSRFDDSDSDEAMAMDEDGGNRELHGDEDDDRDEEEENEEKDTGNDGYGRGNSEDEGSSGEDERDGDESPDEDEETEDDSDESPDEENSEEGEDEHDSEDEEDQHTMLQEVFPNAAAFHATVPSEQAQAALNAQVDRIRTSLKTYRKKARRVRQK